MRNSHAGSCVLIAKLSSILKDVTHYEVPSRSVLHAVVAANAPPRLSGATEYTLCPIELSKLLHAFL